MAKVQTAETYKELNLNLNQQSLVQTAGVCVVDNTVQLSALILPVILLTPVFLLLTHLTHTHTLTTLIQRNSLDLLLPAHKPTSITNLSHYRF